MSISRLSAALLSVGFAATMRAHAMICGVRRSTAPANWRMRFTSLTSDDPAAASLAARTSTDAVFVSAVACLSRSTLSPDFAAAESAAPTAGVSESKADERSSMMASPTTRSRCEHATSSWQTRSSRARAAAASFGFLRHSSAAATTFWCRSFTLAAASRIPCLRTGSLHCCAIDVVLDRIDAMCAFRLPPEPRPSRPLMPARNPEKRAWIVSMSLARSPAFCAAAFSSTTFNCTRRSTSFAASASCLTVMSLLVIALTSLGFWTTVLSAEMRRGALRNTSTASINPSCTRVLSSSFCLLSTAFASATSVWEMPFT
eukprot:Opistho-2@79749